MNKAGSEPSPPEPPASERLESWKEIAAYLRHPLRTVQRWEKREGLPIHRHVHNKLATVYAYKPELAAWWKNRRPHLEQEEQIRAAGRRRLPWVAAAVLVLIIGTGASLWLRRQPPLPFQERDWVLIASFDNRTGEDLLDGTLEYALERELSNSYYVNVVPRERVADTLQLMQKAPDTRVDATLGREICLRDGGIRALITGRVAKLDNTYVLSAALADPTRNVAVASFSQEAEGQGEVLSAVRHLSNEVRKTLGEKLPLLQESARRLERVTTPSLPALQLYSEAKILIDQTPGELSRWPAAIELLKQAVRQDPEFAMTHIMLAWGLRNLGEAENEYLPHAKAAFEFSRTASDRERYFILGSYYTMIGHDEKAIGLYQALLQLYPDDFWATNNLGAVYQRLGRGPEAVPYLVRRAELHPNNASANLFAGLALLGVDDRASRFLMQARELASPEEKKNLAYPLAWVEILPAYEQWLRGDLIPAEHNLARIASTLDSRTGYERDALATRVGMLYLTLGKLEAAERSFQAISMTHERRRWLALAAYTRGDAESAREYLRGATGWPTEASMFTVYPILLARLGYLAEAEQVLASSQKRYAGRENALRRLTIVRAELALARGQRADAFRLLQEGLAQANGAGPEFFLGSESLARLWDKQGNWQQAIQVLEEPIRQQVDYSWSLFWMQCQVQLAELYREVGREQEAQDIEAELRKLLAYADPDHAILRQLEESQD